MGIIESFVSNDSCRGVAVLELAVVVPFLILFALFAADGVLTLRRNNEISVISREAGLLTVRSCSRLSAPQSCLNALVTHVKAANSQFPDLHVKVSIYRNDSGTATFVASNTSSGVPAAYNFNVAKLTAIMTAHPDVQRLIVSQVHYPGTAFVTQDLIGDSYEVTIF